MRWAAVFVLLAIVLAAGCAAPKGGSEMAPKVSTETTSLKGRQILMVIAKENFRDEELFTPKGIFEANGATVVVASDGRGEAAGMLGGTVDVDVDVRSAKADAYDAVIFVGGSGVDELKLYENKDYTRLATEAYQQGKVLGAICLGPKVLAAAGVLAGKQATVFESAADYLQAKGAKYTESPTVQSGNIITAEGPREATQFADTVARALLMRSR